MFTNWVLGTGPCGSTCSKADIGTSTRIKRANLGDKFYFGNFSTDFPITNSNNPDETGRIKNIAIQTLVMQNYTEAVLAVSEKDKWEQDLMKFSFELQPNKGREDLNIQARSWKPLTIQGNHLLWHMQIRIKPQIRSDTNTRNECPVTLTKAVYRILLNQTTRLHLPVIDKEGDFIKCSISTLMESGELRNTILKGVTVNQDCTIDIEATPANGYHDNSWLAIPVSIKDQNRRKIEFGPAIWNPATSAEYLSTCCVQIAVFVKQTLNSPVFIDPTPTPNHRFVVYVGSVWKTTIYAKAIQPRRIQSIKPFGRTTEKMFNISQVQSTPDPSVSYVEIYWSPSDQDAVDRITCISAFDDSGEESDEQRCFILEVQTKTFNTTAKSSYGKPYFVDLPASDDQFVCPVDTSCIIPIYIKSDRSIDRVRITEGKIDYVFGKIENITKAGEHLFQTSLTITSSLHGDDSLCLQAVTLDGVASETTCIQLTIEPKDPCYSTPCHNSGLCRVRNDSSGLFDCECLDGYSGPICAKALDRCQPNPCLHGDCYTSPRPYYCYCTDDHVLPNDFTGMNCEQKRDNCVGVGCSGHGVCVDGVLSHTCQCFPGYTGQTCETRTYTRKEREVLKNEIQVDARIMVSVSPVIAVVGSGILEGSARQVSNMKI
ncbi:uncharacterized protein LOC128207896 [Mya arenaria]|uniref:uncharacterized protein LOC128207896 n=1 Tax=Mya arenaria TaxID=6604 RepID=UPI0022E6FE8A|nr:uncharacterized protein LOC128207896 [Mya arenaria]